MQDVRITFLECIYISGIISQILLFFTSKRCQRCSIMLGFHGIEVIGSGKYFLFTKAVLLMVFLVIELKIDLGFSASCKHCHSSSSSRRRADLAVRPLSESDGNPGPISNLHSLSILGHLCSAFTCTDFFPRGFSPAVLIKKGVRVGHRVGKDASYSCVLLITKLRCIHCWNFRKLQSNKNYRIQISDPQPHLSNVNMLIVF